MYPYFPYKVKRWQLFIFFADCHSITQSFSLQPPAAYGCGPVIGLQVPMWTHVAQTPPPVMGSMMPSYATQPLQYQACFMPPLQHSNQGMYFNSQVQSYSVVPQQYIPVANQGFRQHFMMRQPSNVPYIMHHDYVPVVNSGFSHTMGGTPSLQPQFVPSDFYTREAVYEMSTVQHAQYVPQQPCRPTHQISAFGQRRAGVSFNQQPSNAREEREVAKIFPNSEDQGGIDVNHSLQEEQSGELQTSVDCPRSSADTVSIKHEQAPTPLDLQLSDDAEPIQADVLHSPSETTLVGSPLSSDGVQTVCNSPLGSDHSDTEEDELTATEDDQIPTKDTSDEVTFTQSTEPCYFDNVERLEPEQPYDNVPLKPSSQEEQYNSYSKTKPSLKEELCSVQNLAISSSALVGEVTLQHSSSNDSAETCITSGSITSSNQNQHRHHQQSIRSLIDTPVYNTAHSRVLSQLTQPNNSMMRPRKGVMQRPLTTHFRQLFKPTDKGS